MEIQEKVRLIRNMKGWSQKKLSERSGVNVNTIMNFENGKVSSSIDTVIYILNAMGYTLNIVKLEGRND